LLFHYEGPAFEGNRRYEIRTTMVVKSHQEELYELEASMEPVVVQRLDRTGKPIIFDDPLEFDPGNGLN
jgi:hypothetical protein